MYEKNTFQKKEGEEKYIEYFSKPKRFKKDIVILSKKWPHSFENFLTNYSINRVAWLGQACVFYRTGAPPDFKYSYNKLDKLVRDQCDEIARGFINEFSEKSGKRLCQQVAIHGVFL